MNANATDNPLAVSAPWDWVADSYIDIALPFLELFTAAALRRLTLSAGMRIIDVATGPGTLACLAAPQVSRVDAVDFSEQMVLKCRERACELGQANVVVQQADGQALPFEDASFDAGFSMFGLMFFPDRSRGFRELWRVLKPGCAALVSSWAPIGESPLMLARMAAQQAADPVSVPPQQHIITLESAEGFADEMRGAGFVEVGVERVSRDYVFEDFEHLFAGLTRGSAPSELLKRKLGDTEWNRQLTAISNHLAATYKTFPVALGSTALLGYGRKPGDG